MDIIIIAIGIAGIIAWLGYKLRKRWLNNKMDTFVTDQATLRKYKLKWDTLSWLEILASSGVKSKVLYGKLANAKEHDTDIALTVGEIKLLEKVLQDAMKPPCSHPYRIDCETSLDDLQSLSKVYPKV